MGRSSRDEPVEPSDEALCRSVADREPGAFDLLVERYQERAYRIAWSIVRDREDAKDCAQDAFIRLHEAAGSFAGQAKFSTWFYRILVNCCLDNRRRGRGWRRLLVWRDAADEEREDDPIERHPAPVEDPGERMDEDRRVSRVWEAVATLSPRQRWSCSCSAARGSPRRRSPRCSTCRRLPSACTCTEPSRTLRRRLGGKP